MSKKIFFQSSLPRAGSTLLQNIMGQNPDFYVTSTSGTLELLFAARAQYSNSLEFKAQDDEIMKKAWLSFCYYGLHGFYHGITDKPYILDKSRGWGVYYEWLNTFIDKPKIICMVRDLRSIISSMEKNFRKNPEISKNIVNWNTAEGVNIEKRAEHWLQNLPVGIAITRLKEIFDRGLDKHILFIKYEDLCENPKNEVNKIYNYLELPNFIHNFNDVKQITKEDDSVYGVYGDHIIRNEVKALPEDYNEILTLPIANKIYNSYGWFNKYFNYKID